MSTAPLRVGIVGGSGYVGGELARWVLGHPELELSQITSEHYAGQPLARVHPHLRGTRARFERLDDLGPADVLFLALPHGEASWRIDHFASLAPRIVDCSADFRLRDPRRYEDWYGAPHPAADWLPRFVYGLPETHRASLADAPYASGVGCNATAVQLALLPLARAGRLPLDRPVVAEVKVGSSEGGASHGPASHHPVRSGCVRSYAPVGHRHAGEVEQAFEGLELALSITAVELVRGALATCHLQVDRNFDERALDALYRRFAASEPFVDVVHERGGLYRHPEPKLCAGTNRAQIGFALDRERGRLVALCALDNLGKGAAGNAIQTLNAMLGLDERTGLEFAGLHPL